MPHGPLGTYPDHRRAQQAATALGVPFGGFADLGGTPHWYVVQPTEQGYQVVGLTKEELKNV